MLTGGLNEVFPQTRNHELSVSQVSLDEMEKSKSKNIIIQKFMASAYYLMITIFFGKMTGKLVMNVLNFNQFKVCKYVHFQRLLADTCIYSHGMFQNETW